MSRKHDSTQCKKRLRGYFRAPNFAFITKSALVWYNTNQSFEKFHVRVLACAPSSGRVPGATRHKNGRKLIRNCNKLATIRQNLSVFGDGTMPLINQQLRTSRPSGCANTETITWHIASTKGFANSNITPCFYLIYWAIYRQYPILAQQLL